MTGSELISASPHGGTESWRRCWGQVGGLVFGVALVDAFLSRGAFFPGDFERTCALSAVALACAAMGGAPVRVPAAVMALVAGSAVAAAGLAGSPVAAAGPVVGLGIVLAAGVAVGAAAPPRRAGWLAAAVVAVATMVASSAWLGIAARHAPWVGASEGVWRGASTLTYANAAGVAAAMGMSLAVAWRATAGTLAPALATTVLWIGVACSLSRAAWLAALAGIALVAVLLGWRRVLVAVAPGLVGAGLAVVALVPSMVELRPHQPALAVAGLILGLAATWWLTTRSLRARDAMVLVALLGACAVALLLARDSVPSAILSPRLTPVSQDRVAEWSAAWDAFADQPLAGSGPGNLRLVWRDDLGRPRFARFAHNEYLELAATEGIVGLAAFGLAVVLFTRELRRGRQTAPSWVRAGGGGALAGFALASAFDFLWHVPALPMTAALLAGLLLSRQREATG